VRVGALSVAEAVDGPALAPAPASAADSLFD
jgi:hypothetical protein